MNFNEKSTLYIKLFMECSSTELIHNAESKMTSENVGGFIFPVTINNTEYDSSFVCSPYNALTTYPREELFRIKNRLLRFGLSVLISAIDSFLKLGKVNKNVCINNFLLSTNPYPKWDGEGAAQQLQSTKTLYPQHAIMYRSLNHHINEELMKQLKKLGFIFAASRQAYIFDSYLGDFIHHNNTQNDRRAFANSEYQLVTHDQITESDYPSIFNLYNQLNLEKYSKHNPQISLKLIAYCHKNHIFTMLGLRDKEGILQGIVGLFESELVVTVPLFGYNVELSKKKAIYRILIYLILEYTESNSRCLNLASGAAQFKLLRGGRPIIEYTAIYINHLPFYRRVTWKIIQWMANGIFVPLAKKYKL